MIHTPSLVRSPLFFPGCTLGAVIIPWAVLHAATAIHERVTADPQGSVEIVDVAGSVSLSGWDRPQIEVTGTTGSSVDRVDVSANGSHASVTVVSRSGFAVGDGHEANLVIHVPVNSAITATLVSADLKLANLHGDVTLQTVSGGIGGEVDGDLHAHTVSGSVRLAAPHAHQIEVRTVTGDMEITGGGGGEVEFTSISGDLKADLGTVARARFKTVSGGLTAVFALAADGQIEGESVSGNLWLNFAGSPAADFDVQTLSGEISNCFGPKPQEPRYGPGSRLEFKNGDGHARVHIETKSGDVHLCASGLRTGHTAALPAEPCPGTPAPGAGELVAYRRDRPIFPLL